jgi:hypothetical protein
VRLCHGASPGRAHCSEGSSDDDDDDASESGVDPRGAANVAPASAAGVGRAAAGTADEDGIDADDDATAGGTRGDNGRLTVVITGSRTKM